MKFLVLLLGTVFFSEPICFAQNRLSLSGEASFLFVPKIIESPYYTIIESKSKSGYGGSFFCNYHVNKNFSSSLGIRIAHMNFYFVNDYGTTFFWNDIALRDISFPLLVTGSTSEEKNISFNLSIGICWGIATPFSVNTADSAGNSVFNQSTDLRMRTQHFSLMINAGISWNINNKFSVFSRGGVEFLTRGFYVPDRNFISDKAIKNINLGIRYKLGKNE